MINTIGEGSKFQERTTNRAIRANTKTTYGNDAQYREQDLLTLSKITSKNSSQFFDSKIGGEDPLMGLDPYLSPENVARYLDVSRKFIYELMARHEIESVSVGGRLKRIKLSALETWLGRHNKRRQA